MTDLATVQKWLTSILVKPGNLHDKICMANKHYQVDSDALISVTERLSSEQKIGIYARGYVLRLLECLEAEFPALQHLLGEELFSTFAKAYLVKLPSTSPDLYDLGRNFPAFLQAAQPPEATAAGKENSYYNLPAELAKLERALAVAARKQGTEGEDLSQVPDTLLLLFGAANFRTSPCLQLLEMQYPLLNFVKAVMFGKDAEVPAPKQTFVAISRKSYRIQSKELEPWQWHFLQSLQQNADMRSTINATSEKSGISKETVTADLFLWLPAALNSGFVCS